ncbi:phosphate ABC transporter permease subunit PstC [Nocardioides marmorisolisilvae]|uniref:Phosphate transport system permease protein n=1 Tax=Nocardioides marmorisolisilvae TaxID=1542737 RepID=A0A3N0DS20_9ACTN|nr:phosphate ABC transporter permease subunit PstC [Nocardioides marmorisolisilvae]RNL78410.1 phosphate ABC transporter permease subunit PstC [Nocardioides marmorisolisilvae]
MSALLEHAPPPPPRSDERREIHPVPPRSDRIFVGAVRTASVSTLVVMGLIGLFLLLRAMPALKVAKWHFLTEHQWLPEVNKFGVASLLWGTILIALIALAVAVPVAFGAALFISEYAPRSLKKLLITLTDLMAAVPAVVYAMWGFFWLQGHLLEVSKFLSDTFGPVLPFLRVDNPDTLSSYSSSAFIAGVAVSAVVLPTITSVMREVFSQAPVSEREGAIALGATKWGMIRTVVLPFGRGGIIGGIMLGLGRALGETIVVFLIISPMFDFTTHPLQSGTNSIAPHIALRSTESSGTALSGLLACGLVLFLFTLLINTAAGFVISRSRSGAATEI